MKRKEKYFVLIVAILILCSGCGASLEGVIPTYLAETKIAEKSEVPTEVIESTKEEVPIEPVSTDEIIEITISAAGDVTLGNHQLQDYGSSFRQMYDGQEDKGYFFKNVKPIFEADDMTIVNFEGVLTFSEELQEKAYNMKGDPEYIYILTAGSVEAVSFGNNHRLDYMKEGSDDTVKAFQEAGIAYAYDKNIGIYETKGIKIGFVSVNEVSHGVVVEKYLKEGIEKLQEDGADIILASCHWGIEGDNYPEEYQTELGQKCINWGADLVIGHHPHVLQGIDVYEGKFILYSLGNFCFGGNRNPPDKDTMIFQQTFTFVNGEKQLDSNIKVTPCSLSSVSNRNNFQPTPAEGEEAKRIIDRINEFSEGNGISFDYDGLLMLK